MRNLPNVMPGMGLQGVERVLQEVINYLRDSQRPSGWESPANVTEDRSYDANSTTTDELADVLGTLINDLKNRNII